MGANRARPLRTEERGRGRAWSARGPAVGGRSAPPIPRPPTRTRRPKGCTWDRGAGGRAAGSPASRLGALPCPPHVFRAGSQALTAATAVVSALFTQTGARGPGTGIPRPSHVSRLPGPGGEHPAGAASTFQGRREKAPAPSRLRGRQLTLAEEMPRRAPRGAPSGRALPSPAGLAGAGHKGPPSSPFGEKFSEGPQVALEAERLRCKSRVLAGSSVGNFTTHGWAGETTAHRAPFMLLAISRSELRPRFAPVGRERTSRAAWTLGASVPMSLGFGGPGCLKTGHIFTFRGSRWSG